MTKVKVMVKQRNWVAKNNRHKSARHRDATQYQRQPKHRNSNEQVD